MKTNKLVHFFQKNRTLLFSYALFLVPFLITRLPYFLYYPVVTFNLDDGGYYQIADQIGKGFWPHLSIRTPGYPLMLKLVFAFFSSNFAVIVLQHLLTLAAALFFIYALARSFPRYRFLPVAGALALAAYVSSGIQSLTDSTLMTDSPFASFLVFAFAALFLGLRKKKGRLLLLSSLAMAWAILIRPAGMFLAAIYLLTLLYLLWNRYPRSASAAFAIPFPALLLLVMSYNLFSIGSFSVSTFGEHALISFTTTFLKQDGRLGTAAKTAVERCRQTLSNKEKHILRHSWDYSALNRVFGRNYESNRILVATTFFEQEAPTAYDLYLKWRPAWRKMALNAIAAHPGIAIKYVYSNLMVFFRDGIENDEDYYSGLRFSLIHSRSLREQYGGFADPLSFFNRRFNTREYAETLSEGFTRFLLKEYYVPRRWKYFRPAADGNGGDLVPTSLQRLHQRYLRLHRPIFRSIFWIPVFFLVFGFSVVQLFRTRGRYPGVFVLFTLCLSAFLYGVFVAVSAFPYLRYNYTLEYVYYLAPFLVPLGFRRGREGEAE